MDENRKAAKGWKWAGGGTVAVIIAVLANFTTLLNNLGFEIRPKQNLPAAAVSEVVTSKEPATEPLESASTNELVQGVNKDPQTRSNPAAPTTKRNIAPSKAEDTEPQIGKAREPQAVPNRTKPKTIEPVSLPSFPMEAELSRSKSSRTISEIGVSVSVVFQALDGEEFATLTISHLGGAPLVEPILGPGSTFQVEGREEQQFAIDVVQVDFATSVLKVAIRED